MSATKNLFAMIIVYPLAKVAEQGMPPLLRTECGQLWVLVDLTQIIFSPMPGSRPYTNNHAHKKLTAKVEANQLARFQISERGFSRS